MHKVSVIIPTYNCGQYIAGAIESALDQTYTDFEVIIIDDGSTDNTKEVVMEYIMKSPGKIRYIYQDNNGVSAARNRGILEAKGQLVAFLDADDKWVSQRLEKSVQFLEDNNYDWICSAFYRYQRDTEVNEIRKLDKEALSITERDICLLKEGLFYFSTRNIHTNTILVKREHFDKIGLFDENLHSSEDWDMWLRFEEGGLKGGYLDIPLAYYMIRNDGIMKSNLTNESHLKVAVKHARILGIGKDKIRKSLGGIYYKYADIYFSESKRYFKAACFTLMGFYYYPKIGKILKGIGLLLRKVQKGDDV